MRSDEICGDLRKQIGKLFTYTKHGEFYRIRTPYLYPDGDNIDLFCKSDGRCITVTDLAETTGWLRSQSISRKRSPKQDQLIHDACVTHGVEFHRGMLRAQQDIGEDLASVITRVAQAALRVSDVCFTFRTRTPSVITDEVAEHLEECKLKFDRSEKIAGRSGREWTIDFRVQNSKRSCLVNVLTTWNRSSALRITEHVLAAWHDLEYRTNGPESLEFVSLFNDTIDVWKEDDFKLLEPVSTISLWSRPDKFVDILTQDS